MDWTCQGACLPGNIIPTSAAAGLRFREVGGVAVYVEDHITGGIPDCGVEVCGGVAD